MSLAASARAFVTALRSVPTARASARAAATCRFGGDGYQAMYNSDADLPGSPRTGFPNGTDATKFKWISAPPTLTNGQCTLTPGTTVTVEAQYAYRISILGIRIYTGWLDSKTGETVE
jgi:hypothetical protein